MFLHGCPPRWGLPPSTGAAFWWALPRLEAAGLHVLLSPCGQDAPARLPCAPLPSARAARDGAAAGDARGGARPRGSSNGGAPLCRRPGAPPRTLPHHGPRVLDTLVPIGVMRQARHRGAAVRFDPTTARHHPWVCLSCQTFLDVDAPALDPLPLPAPRPSPARSPRGLLSAHAPRARRRQAGKRRPSWAPLPTRAAPKP
jgi:hypothetical protein